MAFHFQPQADSSDDEQVDLTAWQTGARPHATVAPRAAANDPAEEEHHAYLQAPNSDAASPSNLESNLPDGEAVKDEDEVVSIPEIPDLPEQEVEEEQADDSNNVIAFSSNNDSASSRPPTTSREQSESRKRKRGRPSAGFTSINQRASPSPPASDKEGSAMSGRVLVPVIPRVEAEELDSDVEDFTKGRNRVRLIKREVAGEYGEIGYVVEFKDLRLEEVCVGSLTSLLACLSSCLLL